MFEIVINNINISINEELFAHVPMTCLSSSECIIGEMSANYDCLE